MILKENEFKIEVNPVLAEPLLNKWGYVVDEELEVNQLHSIISELSAWGIPYTLG
jgi:hypothetical protein